MCLGIIVRIKLAILALVTLWLGAPAQAACTGTDLRTSLSDAERRALADQVQDIPFGQGNHWTARRGDQVIHLVGTMHLDDPRHDEPEARLRPLIQSAGALLVETDAGSAQALRDLLTQSPELLILQDTSLPAELPEDDWQAVVTAARAFGLPPFMVSRFQPWYLSALLSTPPCAQDAVAMSNGLDKRLMSIARAADVPIAPLEGFETVFARLADIPLDTQMRLLLATLRNPERPVDLLATTTAAYFDEEAAESWVMAQILAARGGAMDPVDLASDTTLLNDALLTQRNRAWIPVILSHLGDQPLVVAFGAAHLIGDQGVLQLLADQGFALTRQPF